MSKKALSKEQIAANKKRAVETAQITFTPKSYKELVDWFSGEIISGTAQKRDFLNKATALNAVVEKSVAAKAEKAKAEKK
ncbi:MAG TPA: hypothetical protein ENH85_06335 [Candidatus Scalindua sp.]|nr:hypothetical protein [Candidatus Scalindua sp.]